MINFPLPWPPAQILCYRDQTWLLEVFSAGIALGLKPTKIKDAIISLTICSETGLLLWDFYNVLTFLRKSKIQGTLRSMKLINPWSQSVDLVKRANASERLLSSDFCKTKSFRNSDIPLDFKLQTLTQPSFGSYLQLYSNKSGTVNTSFVTFVKIQSRSNQIQATHAS